MNDAKEKIEAWRQDYNTFRPHGSLNNLTPSEYARYHTADPLDQQNSQISLKRVV